MLGQEATANSREKRFSAVSRPAVSLPGPILFGDDMSKIITRDTIKAIPTRYLGIDFKSKMEARFAKWCEDNNQRWPYEPEGLTDGKQSYLPDFYLPDSKMIVEIKPVFFLSETYKFDMLLNSETFDGYTLAVLDLDQVMVKVLKFSPKRRVGGFPRKWHVMPKNYNPSEYGPNNYYHAGLCIECRSLLIINSDSYNGCPGCGYFSEPEKNNGIFAVTHADTKGLWVKWERG